MCNCSKKCWLEEFIIFFIIYFYKSDLKEVKSYFKFRHRSTWVTIWQSASLSSGAIASANKEVETLLKSASDSSSSCGSF